MSGPFVIIGSQRTGSTWLRTLLDSHPLIRCYGEVLNLRDVTERSYPKYVSGSSGRKFRHYLARGGLLREYLDQLLYEDPSGKSATGFKLMYSMTRWRPYEFPMVLGYIRQRRLPVIHLTRRNVLHTYLSRETAKASQVWHSQDSVAERPKLHLPPEGIVGALSRIEHEDQTWHAKLAPFEPLSITYEELTQEFDSVAARILSFLDVDPTVHLESPLRKINPKDVSLLIENFAAVRSALAGTRFAPLLEPGS